MRRELVSKEEVEVVMGLITNRQVIHAIKMVRGWTELGLKDSKDLVERVRDATDSTSHLIDELARLDIGFGKPIDIAGIVVTPAEQLTPSDALTNRAILSVLTALLLAIKEQTETIKDLMEELS